MGKGIARREACRTVHKLEARATVGWPTVPPDEIAMRIDIEFYADLRDAMLKVFVESPVEWCYFRLSLRVFPCINVKLHSIAFLGLAVALSVSTGRGQGIFQRIDKNADGKVTPDELPNAEAFARFDTNADGVILLDEAAKVYLAERQAKAVVVRPAAMPVPDGPKAVKPGDVGVGRAVPDFAFKDRTGVARRLSDCAGKAGVVVVMTSATCPVSKRYMTSLVALEGELKTKNIGLLVVNPFGSEKAAEIDAQLAEAGIGATYAQDPALAASLGARTTAEVFLLDPTRTLIYRGALDDQYGLKYNLDAPRVAYLRLAVTAMLAGRRPTIAATEAPGCELDLPVAAAAPVSGVTYHGDVARILQQNCVGCHREQGIAPFALDDVAEVTDRAKVIARVLADGTMPPWFAAPLAAGNPWGNDCSLAERDKADLLAWLRSADRPMGEVGNAPAKLVFADEWAIGKPDYIVQLPQPVAVKADGVMPYQFVTTQTTLTEDRWVSAYEIIPTDRSVVHHVLVNVHLKGAGRARDREEGGAGYWAAYVPGNGSRVYPPGFARKLPAGATISFQIHYTPSGKAVQEQMRMGLIFAKEPPRYLIETLAIAKHDLDVPPGAANHVEVTERSAPFDVNVMAFMAHMHVRGKAFKYELLHVDGSVETLLEIPRYDFNWQIRYDYAKPRLLTKGARMRLTAVFDNSAANKANPDPTQRVKWGPQTYDEMMIGYLEHFVPAPQGLVAR